MVAALHTRVCMFFACLLSVVCLCVVCVGQAPEGGLVFSVRVSGKVGCKTATAIPEVVFRAALCCGALWPGGLLILCELSILFYLKLLVLVP